MSLTPKVDAPARGLELGQPDSESASVYLVRPQWEDTFRYRVFREVREICQQRWRLALGYAHGTEGAGPCAKAGELECANPLCRALAADKPGQSRCRASDHAGRKMAAESKSGCGVSFVCHAGITRITVPVRLKDRLAGYVETGAGGLIGLLPGSVEWQANIKRLTSLGFQINFLDHALRALIPEEEAMLAHAIQLACLAALSMEEGLGLQPPPARPKPVPADKPSTLLEELAPAMVDTIPPANLQPNGEKDRILAALTKAHGNRERAAASLGMSRATFFRRLRKYELSSTRDTVLQ